MIADQLLSRISKSFEGRLLDIPVGTGIFTVDTYKALDKADIIGVDFSPDMLDRCRMLMEGNAVQISLKKGDVGDLDLPDDAFDLILCMNGVHVFPDKERAYASMLRVLKPGGVFLGCFYIKNERKISDFWVKHFLVRKGWFTPPFETKESLLRRLEKNFDIQWLHVEGSIVSFECIKRKQVD